METAKDEVGGKEDTRCLDDTSAGATEKQRQNVALKNSKYVRKYSVNEKTETSVKESEQRRASYALNVKLYIGEDEYQRTNTEIVAVGMKMKNDHGTSG